jgi:ABC-type transport system involved in cytochrome c biogenesis ATPase subunit
MAIIAEIAKWVSQQPAWISDATRRLFHQGTLTPADITDLASMAKSNSGIEDAERRTPVPLDPATIPQKAPDQPPINITGIRDPKFINAISSPAGIGFAQTGITTVYGYNGAGKSGYGRVLKKACRARQTDQIYPNIFADSDATGPAQATFEWVSGDANEAAVWTDGSAAPESLSRIAVFDSHCARVFLDDQAEVSYVPYGLDILRDLASYLQQVQRQIDAEATGKKFDMARLNGLRGDTQVGKLIAGLKHTSDFALFQNLAKFTDVEVTEKDLLAKQLGEGDPAKAALSARRFATRLQALDNDISLLAEPLSDENVEALETAFRKLTAAEKAATLAASVILDDGKALQGTGTEPWELLMRSALKFATETVYPGEEYPGPAADSQCVLCQQPLAEDARVRLKNFAAFLESDSQRQVNEHRNQAKVLYKAMKGVDVNAFPSDATILDELEEPYPELHGAILEFVADLGERRKTVMQMAAEKSLKGLGDLPESPSIFIMEIATRKRTEANQLDSQMTPDIRAVATKRLAEMNAREKLAELLGTVSEAITSLKLEQAYIEASRACSTTAVTRKMNELYDQTVTAELQATLVEECRALGVRGEILGLDMTGQRGSRLQKLKLAASPKYARVKPSSVLSEGEQRAVALAAFLAEINVEGDGSGVVFDDPVSSLDQIRKERIASRLVLEAKKRQVIVFTHDLSFAWALREFADGHGVQHEERFVFQVKGSAGNVQDDFPFEAKKLASRVNVLKEHAVAARRVLDTGKDFDGYNDKARQLYRRMRDTWELVVEDLLFNASVKRFKRSINTQQLVKVEVNDDDIKEIFGGMSRCSMFTHEGGAEDPPPLPTPDDLDQDLTALTGAVERMKRRSDDVEKRRKEKGIFA